MKQVIEKNFTQIQKEIAKKSSILLDFLEKNIEKLHGNWNVEQDDAHQQLIDLCFELEETIDQLDEVELPKYKRK